MRLVYSIRCVGQKWQNFCWNMYKFGHIISFRDDNRRGFIQTEYSVRHEDLVLQN